MLPGGNWPNRGVAEGRAGQIPQDRTDWQLLLLIAGACSALLTNVVQRLVTIAQGNLGRERAI